MRAERWLRAASASLLILFGVTCRNGEEPGGAIPAPRDLLAEAVGMRTVRVSWMGVQSDEVTGYEIQRRQDLHGEFETVQQNVPPNGATRIAFFDTSVEPDTYYGYRVRAVSRFGARSSL